MKSLGCKPRIANRVKESNMYKYDVVVEPGETKEVWLGIYVPISQGMPFLQLKCNDGETYLNQRM